MTNKCFVYAGVFVMLFAAMAEAQLFRRFRSPAPQQQQYAPQQQQYSPQQQYYGQRSPQQRQYRPQQQQPQQAYPNAGQQRANATQNQNQAPQYRAVTVYDPRTGQRTTRMVVVPQSSLANNPYSYGSNGRLRKPTAVTPTVAPAQTGRPKLATSTERPTSRPQSKNQSVLARNPAPATMRQPEIRLDRNVRAATFEAQADGASRTSTNRQFSILETGPDVGARETPEVVEVELTAPEN